MKEFEYGGEDVFSVHPTSGAEQEVATVGKARQQIPDGLLFKTDLPVDDGDPWVDTDSVDGSELGTDLMSEL